MKFEKVLTKNDIGATHSHQSGFHIPKSNKELLDFLPFLDSSILNPSIYIDFMDEMGGFWRFRYIYYNNKFHSSNGTRDEYRITRTSEFMRERGAVEGDKVIIRKNEISNEYSILIQKSEEVFSNSSNRIKLKGWQAVY